MERPSLKLTFHESSRLRGRRQRGTNPVLGVDVEVREDVLERFCFRHLGAKEYDLLVIAGAVAFIDRKCRRRRSLGWSRDLHLRLPVHTPAFWRSAEIYRALCEVLVFLTGDNWSFEFRSRSSRVGFLSRQQSLGLSFNAPIVLPSSHGLDSFASSLLLKSDFPNTEIVRVVTKNRTLGASPDLGTVIELQVPVDIHVKGGEPTFRTRTFLFFTVAGIASATSGAISTNIPENGQGSLGPTLVLDGNEWPYRGSHPGFTKRLSTLLGLVCETPVTYEHPQIWRTKGEVLTALVERGLARGWEKTRSCPRDQRHIRYSGPRIQCGICGGCLLRRMSLQVAGLAGVERYYWDDLAKAEISQSLIRDARRTTNENDVRIFISNAMAMKRLADLSVMGDKHFRLEQACFEVSQATREDTQQVMSKIRHLLKKNAAEWADFVQRLPQESWFRRMAFL